MNTQTHHRDIHGIDAAIADTDIESLIPVPGQDFGDAVFAPEIEEGSDDISLGERSFASISQMPHRIKNFPVRRPARGRRDFQETEAWEGVVTQVTEEGLVATLTRRYQDFPAEEASVPWEEIQDADRPLAVLGATFSWRVGYLTIGRQKLSVSHIQFRRIPGFSEKERQQAKAKAADYALLFDRAD